MSMRTKTTNMSMTISLRAKDRNERLGKAGNGGVQEKVYSKFMSRVNSNGATLRTSTMM